ATTFLGGALTRPLTSTSSPLISNSHAVGESSIFVLRILSKPPSRWRAPSRIRKPFPTHGVVIPPTLILPAARSKRAPGWPAKSPPWIHVQRSACSPPQLCPIIPGHFSSAISRSPTLSGPLNSASAYGLRNLVFGSGAEYSHSYGRCSSGSPWSS